MPMYVVLFNWTDQGVKNIKDSPARSAQALEAAKAAGIDIKSMYATMGEYDMIAIAEAPSDEVGTAFLLRTAALGNLRTKTMRAFTMEEFANIVSNLP